MDRRSAAMAEPGVERNMLVNDFDAELNNTLMLEVGPDEDGMRLDAFIGLKAEDISRSYAAHLIESGAVSIGTVDAGESGNDANRSGIWPEETSKKRKVKAGDLVAVEVPEPELLDVTPEDIPLEIVYEDDDVIVVNKPSGMLVHPSVGNYSGTLVNAIMFHCGDSLSSINGVVRPGIVHRIDKDTSGLLMIAKNDAAHESLAAQLKEHSVTREYTALVYDIIREDELTIDEPIGRDERNRMRRAVWGSGQKEAITHIRVVKRYSGISESGSTVGSGTGHAGYGGRSYTLIKARLETGRTHQIRVHMAYVKHPLVGDELYGPKKQASKLMGYELDGQLLHAGVLGFVHPRTGEYMEFEAPLPMPFAGIVSKLDAAE